MLRYNDSDARTFMSGKDKRFYPNRYKNELQEVMEAVCNDDLEGFKLALANKNMELDISSSLYINYKGGSTDWIKNSLIQFILKNRGVSFLEELDKHGFLKDQENIKSYPYIEHGLIVIRDNPGINTDILEYCLSNDMLNQSAFLINRAIENGEPVEKILTKTIESGNKKFFKYLVDVIKEYENFDKTLLIEPLISATANKNKYMVSKLIALGVSVDNTLAVLKGRSQFTEISKLKSMSKFNTFKSLFGAKSPKLPASGNPIDSDLYKRRKADNLQELVDAVEPIIEPKQVKEEVVIYNKLVKENRNTVAIFEKLDDTEEVLKTIFNFKAGYIRYVIGAETKMMQDMNNYKDQDMLSKISKFLIRNGGEVIAWDEQDKYKKGDVSKLRIQDHR